MAQQKRRASDISETLPRGNKSCYDALGGWIASSGSDAIALFEVPRERWSAPISQCDEVLDWTVVCLVWQRSSIILTCFPIHELACYHITIHINNKFIHSWTFCMTALQWGPLRGRGTERSIWVSNCYTTTTLWHISTRALPVALPENISLISWSTEK